MTKKPLTPPDDQLRQTGQLAPTSRAQEDYAPPGAFPPALWDDLAAVDQKLAAQRAGATLGPDGRFTVDFLGAPHTIDPAARAVTAPPGRPPAGFQKTMILLVYLSRAGRDVAPGPAGRLVGPFELPGGTLFFRGPHELAHKELAAAYRRTPEELRRKAEDWGAWPEPPALFRWRALPNVDVALFFDPEDEEFPADVRWVFDAHAHYHLPLDALWALVNVISADLSRA
ncbi:MAG: DUF3786 domain-containing protein [Deltaproteobacteria bacterium]|jgi:hypothetical protein|nr:DUF3786 domain-containing protein [Deltaproteobacteria bacterium]